MISSATLGKRIAATRKRRRITQASVAEILCVSRPTVAAIEKGARRPSDEELVRIAEALCVSVHDLLKEHAAVAAVSPRFRVAAGTKLSRLEVESAVEKLRVLGGKYVELERIHGVQRAIAPLESLTAYRVPGPGEGADPVQAGEHAARTVRGWLDLGDAPALNLCELLEMEAGLRIFDIDFPGEIAAIFIWGDELGGCVGLNSLHPEERRRWSLAHETGHFLRDREAGEVLLTAGPARRDASESFADSFALEFLLPANGVRRRFSNHVRAQGSRFTVGDLVRLAGQYQVSFQAMSLRLEDLDLLPAATYESISSSSIGVRESRRDPVWPRQSDEPSERFPERYRALAVSAFHQGMISESELADYLQCDRVTARSICQQLAHLHEDGVKVAVDVGRNLLG